MTKVVLHIGGAKCGSTFLQKTLMRDLRFFRKKHSLTCCPSSFIKNEDAHEINHYIRSGCRKFDKVFLSYEGLIGFREDLHDVSEKIENAKVMLDGVDATILVYTRRQDTYIESLYSQIIKEGRKVDFNNFKLNYKKIDWFKTLEQWSEHFNVVAAPFEIIKERPEDFLDVAFDIFGINFSPRNISIVNPSISKKGIEQIETLIDHNQYDVKKDRIWFQDKYQSNGKLIGLLHENERVRIIKDMENTNKNLFTKFMPGRKNIYTYDYYGKMLNE